MLKRACYIMHMGSCWNFNGGWLWGEVPRFFLSLGISAPNWSVCNERWDTHGLDCLAKLWFVRMTPELSVLLTKSSCHFSILPWEKTQLGGEPCPGSVSWHKMVPLGDLHLSILRALFIPSPSISAAPLCQVLV